MLTSQFSLLLPLVLKKNMLFSYLLQDITINSRVCLRYSCQTMRSVVAINLWTARRRQYHCKLSAKCDVFFSNGPTREFDLRLSPFSYCVASCSLYITRIHFYSCRLVFWCWELWEYTSGLWQQRKVSLVGRWAGRTTSRTRFEWHAPTKPRITLIHFLEES